MLWGTLSPLVYELLGIGKISVGPPVFAAHVFGADVLPLMVFLAIGMHSAWRRGKLTVAAKPLWWLAGAAVLLSVAIQGLVFKEFHLVGPDRFQLRLLDHVLRGCSNPCAAGARTKR